MTEKQYKNISEVSKLLSIKEHVIRHWDSIDPKTNENPETESDNSLKQTILKKINKN